MVRARRRSSHHGRRRGSYDDEYDDDDEDGDEGAADARTTSDEQQQVPSSSCERRTTVRASPCGGSTSRAPFVPHRAAARTRRRPHPGPDAPPSVTLEIVQDNEELVGLHRLGRPGHGRDGVHRARIPPREPGREHRLSRCCTGWATASVRPRLASVAGYLHDVGNALARDAHGQTGAVIVYQALHDTVQPGDLMPIVAAIANHEETEGTAVSPGVGRGDPGRQERRASQPGAHERADRSRHPRPRELRRGAVVPAGRLGRSNGQPGADDRHRRSARSWSTSRSSSGRMQLCRRAAEMLDARFRLVVNGAELA